MNSRQFYEVLSLLQEDWVSHSSSCGRRNSLGIRLMMRITIRTSTVAMAITGNKNRGPIDHIIVIGGNQRLDQIIIGTPDYDTTKKLLILINPTFLMLVPVLESLQSRSFVRMPPHSSRLPPASMSIFLHCQNCFYSE